MTRFEQHTGIPSGTINKMTDGMSTRSLTKIIEKCPELNVVWLLTGEGQMLVPKDATVRFGNIDLLEAQEAISSRLKHLASSQGFSSLPDMARACGLSPRAFSPFSKNGISSRDLVTLAARFPDTDIDYLLTGRSLVAKGTVYEDGGIPLLPFDAIAGGLADNISQEVPEMLPTPALTNGKADFAIRVDGDSMYPRYHSGDVLFVRKIDDPSFFQWGKVYVVATKQGCVVKRLFPCKDDDNFVTCHSENSANYPDYDIHREDILGVGLVVGHAGLD